MSFGALLGSLAGDLIRGNFSTMGYRIRQAMADSAEDAVRGRAEGTLERNTSVRGAGGDSAADEARAWLLIRGMISAAAADGEIDPDEREKILSKARGVLSADDLRTLETEMGRPQSPEALAALATDGETREQLYAISCGAIVVDTDAERTHLKRLAKALHLDEAAVTRIHAATGVPG